MKCALLRLKGLRTYCGQNKKWVMVESAFAKKKIGFQNNLVGSRKFLCSIVTGKLVRLLLQFFAMAVIEV